MHDAIKDLLQFVGFLLLLGVIWFFNGGKDKAIEQRTQVKVTDASGNVITNTNQPEGVSGSSTSGTKAVATSTLQNGFLTDAQYQNIANKSPLFKVVRISHPSGSGGTDASREYITVSYRQYGEFIPPARVNITGWTLRSQKTGHVASIGKAVLLPSSYASTAVKGEDDILIRLGDKVIIASGRSPIGNSFLINKCTGYFSQFQTFIPSLSQLCPVLKDEPTPPAPNALNDRCLDYIKSWPTCKTQVNSLPQYLSHECQVFISEEANYNKCVSHHQPDEDFFSKEWRVFLNRSEPLWKSQREIIQLLDSNGKVVDEVSY